jgi:hypothetical protein
MYTANYISLYRISSSSNGYYVSSNLNVEGDISVQGSATTLLQLIQRVEDLVPPGTIHAYAGNSPPKGYLPCNGSAFSRTTYSKLFAAISTKYGDGDKVYTFNVPDLQGRAIVGAGNG